MTIDAPIQPRAEVRQSTFKTLFGTGVGNLLEWYDWNVYASFAVYISAVVFGGSEGRDSAAFLETMAVFALAFVARPLGGVLFGWLTDRVGRKRGLAVAVLTASAGSLIVGLCPSYAQIGVWAPIILLVGRIIQGLAHGGELPSAQTYLSEAAPAAHRGLWASSIYITGTLGIIMGTGLGLVFTKTFSHSFMLAWGWRIPFIIGAVLGLFALWIRSSMEETEAFEEDKDQIEAERKSVWADLLEHRRTALQVIGMTMGLTIAYYIWSVTIPAIAKANWGYEQADAFAAGMIGNVVFIAVMPLWGKLSDHWGRRPNMLIAMIGAAVLYFPVTKFISSGEPQLWKLALGTSLMLILLGAYLGIAPAAYAELFPTEVRASGFGIPYAIAIALFGGTAGFISSATAGTPMFFPIYAIVGLVVSALTILTLPETKGIDLHRHTEEIARVTAEKQERRKR